VPEAIRGYHTKDELHQLIGTGVSAAAIWHVRDELDAAGFSSCQIVTSSGFTPEKCRTMALARAPMNMIGTGSFLPGCWHETYATADIIEYDGVPRAKAGREFLLQRC
jgi:nicotinate phosphoribosyltransferase